MLSHWKNEPALIAEAQMPWVGMQRRKRGEMNINEIIEKIGIDPNSVRKILNTENFNNSIPKKTQKKSIKDKYPPDIWAERIKNRRQRQQQRKACKTQKKY